MARGEFPQARADAEAALSARPPASVRPTVLLLAADAAAAQGLHAIAARHYTEVVTSAPGGADAATATVGLAWAELRQGNRERAWRTWNRFAEAFPSDPRAPLLLALAGEVASEAGQLRPAQAAFDRLIARHPGAPEAQGARLSRAILLLRGDREDEAVRDLDTLVRAPEPSAIRERRRLIASLRPPTDVAITALPVATATNGHHGDALDRFAVAFLQAGDPAGAPYVLHGLIVLGATQRGWTDPVVAALAGRLLDGFPTYPPAPALLARVGAAAVTAGRWPIAREAYGALAARAPADGFARSIRVDLAEALLRTGAPAEARRQLADGVPLREREAPRALLLRAEAADALGDRRAALADYDRLLTAHPTASRSPQSLLAHARLLEDAGQRSRARPLLERVVAQSKGEAVAEAAYRLAMIHGDAGEHPAAVEWYLTAAYVGEGSTWARPALLGAGGSLAALDETSEALAIYRTLVPSRTFAGRPEDRALGGEAAYRAAELVSSAARHEEALDLYLTSAHLTAGSPAERRALVGAVRCLVAIGDRPAAEAIYHRLLESSTTEPEYLISVRQVLRARGGGAPAR